MNATFTEYESLRRAHERAEGHRDHWARRIADDAVAGRSVNAAAKELYAEAIAEADAIDHKINEWLAGDKKSR